jgi:hypothetical protein
LEGLLSTTEPHKIHAGKEHHVAVVFPLLPSGVPDVALSDLWPDSETLNPKTFDADVGIAFRLYVAQLQMKGNSFLVRSFYSELRVQLIRVLLDPMLHHSLRESFPPLILDDEHLTEYRVLVIFPNTLCPNTLRPNKKS